MFLLKFQQFLLLDLFLWALHSHMALACHGELLAAGISEQEKQIILHEHNRLRQQVATGHYPGQPGAKNMKEMLWDNDLAERAQNWAENCQFKHDPQRMINRFTMGQNLAIIWSTAPLEPDDGDFPSRIQSWFNEVQKYSFGDAWTPKTGHYSQLVWGDTNLVGCGFSEYKDARKYNKLYVCNYGPGGNVYGYNPYDAGKPSCSAYGLKSSPRYQGLCMAEETDYNDNAIETVYNPFMLHRHQHHHNHYHQLLATLKSNPKPKIYKQQRPLKKVVVTLDQQSQQQPSKAFTVQSTTTTMANTQSNGINLKIIDQHPRRNYPKIFFSKPLHILTQQQQQPY